MQRLANVVAAVLVALALAAPSRAAATAPPTEHVIVDAVLVVTPPDEEGLCVSLDPGRVTVTARVLEDAGEPRPVDFHLYGYQTDPDATVGTKVGRTDVGLTVAVLGGRYCWSVAVYAPEAENTSLSVRSAYRHSVALKIVHTPL